MHTTPRTAPRGFTLVELLVVIAIIGLISAVALPVVLPALNERRVSEAARLLQAVLPAPATPPSGPTPPGASASCPTRSCPRRHDAAASGVLASNRIIAIEPAPTTPKGWSIARPRRPAPVSANSRSRQSPRSQDRRVSGRRPSNHPQQPDHLVLEHPPGRQDPVQRLRAVLHDRRADDGRPPVTTPARSTNSERLHQQRPAQLRHGRRQDCRRIPRSWSTARTTTATAGSTRPSTGSTTTATASSTRATTGSTTTATASSTSRPSSSSADRRAASTSPRSSSARSPRDRRPTNPTYTIFRRPVVSPGARETTLPAGVVIDLTTWNAPTVDWQRPTRPTLQPERSRLPVDPYSDYVDIMIAPSGQVVTPGRGGSAAAELRRLAAVEPAVLPLLAHRARGRGRAALGITSSSTGPTTVRPRPEPEPASNGLTYLLPMPQGDAELHAAAGRART